MSDGDSTEPAAPVAGVVRDAAAGVLPAWACADPARREHMARVAGLLGEWAEALGLPESERLRWCAMGWLHDALRDAAPDELRAWVPEELRDLAPPLLHGPAAAERLADQLDAPALDAIRYHTIGHARLDLLGRALYLADFLEPGREFLTTWRRELRSRMPGDMDAVLREVVAARITHLLKERRPIRPETAGFWSALVEDGA